MKKWLPKLRFLTTALVSAGLLLAPTPSRAAAMHKASVISWHTSLMVMRGGRMVPVMTVNQGSSLQVSDTSQNGWRQVLIHQAGQPARWGWVAESEVSISSETIQVKSLPSAPHSQSVASGGGSAVRGLPGFMVVSANVGYMAPLNAGGGLTYGADIGFHLMNLQWGQIYLGMQAALATASSVPLGFTGNASFSAVQAGLMARELGGSSFYAGIFAGLTIISVSVGPLSASTLQYSMTGLLGYDYRFSSVFSAGPELGLSDIALGGYDSVHLLLACHIRL